MEKLNESKEMYLESILQLSHDKDSVRAIDLAQFMNFSRPSVSRALLLLENQGLIKRDDNEHITLTQSGKKIAEDVYERHNVLIRFFVSIGVDRQTAEQDACRVEHIISLETFEKIKTHLCSIEG